MQSTLPEVWLRGPVEKIPALLQPVAHALLQSREEVNALMDGFQEEYLWHKTAGMASVGFHIQHMAGVLDRLFSYASGHSLSEKQFLQLKMEGERPTSEPGLETLLRQFNSQVDKALQQLSATDEKTLLEARAVGRAKLPSNVLGLLFHAAEHVQRHTGQLIVTVKYLPPPVQ